MTEVGPAVHLTEKARRGLDKKGKRSEELWLKYIEVLILLQDREARRLPIILLLYLGGATYITHQHFATMRRY